MSAISFPSHPTPLKRARATFCHTCKNLIPAPDYLPACNSPNLCDVFNLPTFVKNRRRYTAVLPPAGPAWAGSLMGSSITAAMLYLHDFHIAANILLVLAATVAVIITVGWLVFRSPGFTPGVMPAWAMVSMGVVSLGSASSRILGERGTATSADHWVWWFLFGCCVFGGALGLVTCVLYLPLILTGRAGSPSFTWGLPLVTPMVASTAGMQVHSWLLTKDVSTGYTTFIFWLSCGAFALSILLAPAVFARVYYFYFGPHTRHASPQNRLEPMAAPTTWIPIGVAGQSMASAQSLGQASGWMTAAITYGFTMLIIAIPIGLIALVVHYQAALRGISYSPTWWASTFPVGTLCLGTHALSGSTGMPWLDSVSVFLLFVLLTHAGIATTGGTIALVQKVSRVLLRITGGRR